jgi:uncharacterized protein (DUF952 family)
MMAARKFVYKVAPRAAWEEACRVGAFTGSSDDRRDGFIHLSLRAQLAGTLAKHFRGHDDLVLLQFDAIDLGATLRWEPSRGGEDFPHLYSALPTAKAIAIWSLHLSIDGVPELPQDIAAC